MTTAGLVLLLAVASVGTSCSRYCSSPATRSPSSSAASPSSSADLRRLGHADRGRRPSSLTNALVFFTFFGATLFAFVFRALGGDAVFAPVLKGIDFGPHLGEGGVIVFLTWFTILMSVNLQTSFLTPPFGFTLFYMKGTVPPSITMAHIYRGVIPFAKSVAVNIIYTSCTNE
jgi:TRAP-type mannitol/chloroaromatic compound transport system permease large subunit